MVLFSYLIILSIFFIIIKSTLIKKDFLLSESGDFHQKFSSKITTPLTGGIFIFFGFLFFIFQNLIEPNFIIFIFFVLMLGILSDLKFIKSARKRLFYQLVIIFAYVALSDIQILDTRIHLLDSFLKYKIVNYLFVCFDK